MNESKMEIYRSSVLGDESTKPIRVDHLPENEQEIHDQINDYRLRIKELKSEIETVDGKLRELVDSCPHHYFDDASSFLYDVRQCVVCGTGMGMI